MRFVDDDIKCPLSQEDIYSDVKSWVEAFIENKGHHGLSKKTLKSYKFALKSFLEFVNLYKDDNTMENIGAKFINRYLINYQAQLAKEKLKNTICSNDAFEKYNEVIEQKHKKFLGRNDIDFKVLSEFENTLLHRTNVIKMLLKFISENNEEGHDYQSCFYDIKTIQLKEHPVDSITIEEMDKVVDLMAIWINVYQEYKNYKPRYTLQQAYRDSLLILLYALTGARSSEVVQIRLRDITSFTYYRKEYFKIEIKNGKGGREREVAVQADLIKPHVEFLKENLPDSSYYISSTCTKNGYINKHLSPDTIRKFGNLILKILGINKSGLHSFRRYYATKRIVKDKKPLTVVAKEIGNTVAILERFYVIYKADMGIED